MNPNKIYCEIEDLYDVATERDLIKLTNPEGSAINRDVLYHAIIDASGYIEGYVKSTEGKVTTILKKICENIAIYYLYQRTNYEIPISVEKGYYDAKEDLIRLAKREMNVDDTATTRNNQPRYNVNPVFIEGSQKDYLINNF